MLIQGSVAGSGGPHAAFKARSAEAEKYQHGMTTLVGVAGAARKSLPDLEREEKSSSFMLYVVGKSGERSRMASD